MACQLVSQNLFNIANQPTMFQETICLTDFEKLVTTSSTSNSHSDEKAKDTQNAYRACQATPKYPIWKVLTRQTRSSTPKVDTNDSTEHKESLSDSIPSVSVYKCTYGTCNEVFSKKSCLDFHIDVHRGVHILCTVPDCLQSFTTRKRLNNHLELKHKGFKTNKNLKTQDTSGNIV